GAPRAALRVPAARMALVGEGERSVLRAVGATGPDCWVVLFEDAEGTGLRGLTLDGGGGAGGVRFARGPMTGRGEGARVRLVDLAFRSLGGPPIGADPDLPLRIGAEGLPPN
ncbi:MAG: hypothetical protein KC466_07870, partial [Myxococcales bacterium]|nr:hypothetical protein [Myxococcales bacterium]